MPTARYGGAFGSSDLNERYGWAHWELPWTPQAGPHELLARATDRHGNTQPDTVPFNDGGYQFWAVVRHPVTAVR